MVGLKWQGGPVKQCVDPDLLLWMDCDIQALCSYCTKNAVFRPGTEMSSVSPRRAQQDAGMQRRIIFEFNFCVQGF